MEQKRALRKLQSSGNDRYFKLDTNFDAAEYDVEIMITNEEINKSVLIQSLQNMLPMVPPDIQQGIIKEIFDLAGLDPNQFQGTSGGQVGVPPQGQQPQGQPAQQQAQQPPQAQPPQECLDKRKGRCNHK